MTSTETPPRRLASVSLALSVAGLIPFILLTISLFLIADGSLRAFVAHGLAAYAAIILSFLGGVRYGAALAAPVGAAGALNLIAAVVPALLGWLFVIARPDVALLGLAVLHLLLGGFDFLGGKGPLPQWYRAQRPWLGLTAGATLLIGYLVLVR